MRLYVCWSTRGSRDHHACAKAYRALREAGYEPTIEKVRGFGFLPGVLQGKRRRKLKAMTGKYSAPVLELDDSTVINPSDTIVTWAKVHPKKA